MWKIGNVEVNGQVVLGPMAGVTTAAYRAFMEPFGVAAAYTEMISDCGLIYQNKETYSYLKSFPRKMPLGVQLFGGSKETLLKGLYELEKSGFDYDFVDINLGCPVPKVTKTGAGSAWLQRPDELKEMMKEFVARSQKPVTAKIRLGWDEESINYLAVIKGLEEAGVSMISLHLRTKSQLYAGKAQYHLARGLRSKMNVPLVISGDIFSLDDAINALEITGAEAVMVARGAMGNPQLIKQIDHYLKTGEKIPDATLTEQLEYMDHLARLLIEEKSEIPAIKQLRGILPKFLNSYPGMKPFRVQIVAEIETYQDVVSIIERIKATII